ncbi:hypothetical protein [Zhongshania sp.]|uniref:hypothetical protein n=1 Tax=Zhongshania sp. TaxID=1971902 RepID=UPI0035673F7E
MQKPKQIHKFSHLIVAVAPARYRPQTLAVSILFRLRGDAWKAGPFLRLPNPAYYAMRARQVFNHWSLMLTPWPVYFWFSSTDCDLMHVEYAVKYRNGREAMRCISDAYESAEGATYFSRLTRKEYLRCERDMVRDDIAARMMNY